MAVLPNDQWNVELLGKGPRFFLLCHNACSHTFPRSLRPINTQTPARLWEKAGLPAFVIEWIVEPSPTYPQWNDQFAPHAMPAHMGCVPHCRPVITDNIARFANVGAQEKLFHSLENPTKKLLRQRLWIRMYKYIQATADERLVLRFLFRKE